MQIRSSQSAFQLLKHLRKKSVEEFWIVALRSDKTVVRKSCLFRGTVNSCPVHLRDIFRFACLQNASSILIAHNHPGVSHAPSKADVLLTKKVAQAGDLIGIPLEDHIVIGEKYYSSLKAMGCF